MKIFIIFFSINILLNSCASKRDNYEDEIGIEMEEVVTSNNKRFKELYEIGQNLPYHMFYLIDSSDSYNFQNSICDTNYFNIILNRIGYQNYELLSAISPKKSKVSNVQKKIFILENKSLFETSIKDVKQLCDVDLGLTSIESKKAKSILNEIENEKLERIFSNLLKVNCYGLESYNEKTTSILYKLKDLKYRKECFNLTIINYDGGIPSYTRGEGIKILNKNQLINIELLCHPHIEKIKN